MKNIAVFFDILAFDGYPFDKEEYLRAYQELSDEIAKLGAQFYIVRSQSSYIGGGVFSQSWQLNQQRVIAAGKVQIDVVFDKGRFISDDQVKVFNHPSLSQLCTDKWKTYCMWPELFPQTLLIVAKDQVSTALETLETEFVVIKPVDGAEGKGVRILNRDEIESSFLHFPMLMQEFLDSSTGIPGICAGLHDFRCVVLNGKVMYAYFRTPPPGQLIANLALGGSYQVVPVVNIPEEFLRVVDQVDNKLKEFKPRAYSVDMCLTRNKVRVIELNSRFGLSEDADGLGEKEFKHQLAKTLIELAKTPTI